MTRAPAPDYVPEAPRHSTWVRPPFAFEGKGAAGGHSATHKATAEPTRPQPVEVSVLNKKTGLWPVFMRFADAASRRDPA
ncbi:hypothetical protein LNP20_12085 [Klebsiella pneumoniae subsp. pneumoniae]|nr:hypothetical protein [Klebsiella pneumoniae subsp. pneumoniae]